MPSQQITSSANAARTGATDWPPPIERLNPGGTSPALLVCDHASRHIPAEYKMLGLLPADLDRHIAWDIGAAALTRRLARMLDAPAFLGTYSRLLIDLNRPLHAAIPERSETTDIVGNGQLCDTERERRAERIFQPYHATIAACIDSRQSLGERTFLVAVHSFAPVFLGQERSLNAGVLFGAAQSQAYRVAQRLADVSKLEIGLNEPYQVSPEEDYALLVHGDQRGIPAILLEIRNDHLLTRAGINRWARWILQAIAPELTKSAP